MKGVFWMNLVLAVACTGDSAMVPGESDSDADVDADADTDTDVDTDTDTDTGVVCVDDPNEDNDDLATAIPLPAVTTGLVVLGDDSDFWTITVPMGEEVTVDLTHIDANGDIDIDLRALDNTTLDSSAGIADTEQAVWTNNTGADVDIVLDVDLLGAATFCNDYDLVVTIAAPPPCAPDLEEDNDTLATPSVYVGGPLADLTADPLDPDYYSITVADGFTQQVDIGVDAGGMSTIDTVDVYDSMGMSVDSDDFGPNHNLEWTNATGASADYTVEIIADGCVDYSMDSAEIASADCTVPDAAEPNDTALAPYALLTSPLAGLNATATDTEFYSIEVPAGNQIAFEVLQTTIAGYVELTLSQDGVVVNNSGPFGSAEVAIVNTTAGPLTYILEVEATACLEYDIEWTLDAACGVDDANEDNDNNLTPTAGGNHTAQIANGADSDFFAVGTVNPGETMTVDLTFLDNDGDIDARMFDAANLPAVGASTFGFTIDAAGSSSDDEQMTYSVAVGDPAVDVIVEVFHFNGGTCDHNTYDMATTVAATPIP